MTCGQREAKTRCCVGKKLPAIEHRLPPAVEVRNLTSSNSERQVGGTDHSGYSPCYATISHNPPNTAITCAMATTSEPQADSAISTESSSLFLFVIFLLSIHRPDVLFIG